MGVLGVIQGYFGRYRDVMSNFGVIYGYVGRYSCVEPGRKG